LDDLDLLFTAAVLARADVEAFERAIGFLLGLFATCKSLECPP
jgi:hypothetical protein